MPQSPIKRGWRAFSYEFDALTGASAVFGHGRELKWKNIGTQNFVPKIGLFRGWTQGVEGFGPKKCRKIRAGFPHIYIYISLSLSLSLLFTLFEISALFCSLFFFVFFPLVYLFLSLSLSLSICLCFCLSLSLSHSLFLSLVGAAPDQPPRQACQMPLSWRGLGGGRAHLAMRGHCESSKPANCRTTGHCCKLLVVIWQAFVQGVAKEQVINTHGLENEQNRNTANDNTSVL